jgi:hypothetical protein
MPWTLPDKGEGDNDVQSILFQEYLDVLAAGIRGIDYVYNGLVVTGGADMTPAVSTGMVVSNGKRFLVAGADVTISTAHATNPRIDLIVVTSAGALAVRAGTAGANPKPPARTANDVVIAAVYVPANDTAIATSQITDLRLLKDFHPLCVSLAAADEHTIGTVACGEVTGLEVYLEPGVYNFQYAIRWQAAATSTGAHYAINFTGTAAVYAATLMHAESTTAASTGAASQAGYAVTNSKLISGSGTRTKATTAANLGTSISVDAANSDMLDIIQGYIIVTAAGNLELWHGSEVAANTTVKEGSALLLTRMG